MKKIILIVVTFLSFIPLAHATYSIDYTNNTVCDSNNNCYPVYSVISLGRQSFFLNPSQSYNLDLNSYKEVNINNTPFSSEILEYASIIPFLKDNGIYYKEVMHKKLGELIYGTPFEINTNPRDPEEIRRQLNAFDTIITRVKNGPSFINKPHYLSSSEKLELEDDYLYLFNIKDSGKLTIEKFDNKFIITGPSGEYNIKVMSSNASGDAPKVYSDGINYFVTEGAVHRQYDLKILIDMKNVIMKFDKTRINAKINIYHNNTLYKSVNIDENGMINIDLPLGEIKLTDSLDKEIKTFNVTDNMNLNFTQDEIETTPEKLENSIKDQVETIKENLQTGILNWPKPDKGDVVTLDKNNDSIIVTLPDTLCI